MRGSTQRLVSHSCRDRYSKEIQLTVHLTKERREITSPTKNPRQCGGTTSTNSLSLLAR